MSVATLITTSEVREFVHLVNTGIESWVKAGELLVKMVEADAGVRSRILKACPSISMQTLMAFERMGRRQVYPYLLLETCVASKKLLELPVELQEKYIKEPVEVLCDWRNGPVVRRINLRSLTRAEAERVFCQTGVRPIEEQRKMLFPVEVVLDKSKKLPPVPVLDLNDLSNDEPKQMPKTFGKVIGRFAVRIGVGGCVVFEPTKALPLTTRRIELSGGVAVIEIIQPQEKII